MCESIYVKVCSNHKSLTPAYIIFEFIKDNLFYDIIRAKAVV